MTDTIAPPLDYPITLPFVIAGVIPPAELVALTAPPLDFPIVLPFWLSPIWAPPVQMPTLGSVLSEFEDITVDATMVPTIAVKVA